MRFGRWSLSILIFVLLLLVLPFFALNGLVIFEDNIDEGVIYFSSDSPSNDSSASSIVMNVSYDVPETSYAFLNYNNSLIGWYRGEDDATDSSGNGNDATVYGSGAYTPGLFGNAFYFDEVGDYLNLSQEGFNALDAFTVSMWVRREADYPTTSQHFFISKGNYYDFGTSNWEMFFEGNGSVFRTVVGREYITNNSQVFPKDQWVHIVMTYNRSGVLKSYVDGIYRDQVAVNSTATDNNYYITIGDRYGSNRALNGSIDEILIFDEVLSADEVTQIYDNSLKEIYRTYEGEIGEVTFQGLAVNESGYVYAGEELYVTITNDLALPVTTLSAPKNNSFQSSSNIVFNWTTTSTADVDSYNCNLTLDGSVNISNMEVDKGVLENVSISGLADGDHLWNITCNDSFGNSNSSETWLFNVNTSSFLTVNSPSESTWTTNYNLNFSADAGYSLGSYVLLNLNESLVFWLTGEEGFVDSSGHGHDVYNNASNAVLISEGGVFGKKMDFNGTQNLKIDNSGADFDFDWDNDFSWATWFYPHDTGDNDLIKVGQGSTDTPRLRNYGTTTMIYLEDPADGVGGFNAASTGVTYTDTWHHAVATWDASERNLSVYLDGSLAQTKVNTTYPEFMNYDNLYLGIGLNGSLDEVMVFDTAISGDIVEGLYNASVHSFEYLASVSEGDVLPYVFYGVDKNGRQDPSSGIVTVDVPNSVPVITLLSPGCLERTSDTTPTFSCSANSTNEGDTISYISLYWNQSGEFDYAGMNSFSSADGVATFTRSLSSGESVLWGCYACDSSGNCDFSKENWTLAVGSNSYYVSTTGDDAREGTFDDPFLTVQKCSEIVFPGDTCYIREGTYNETVSPTNSGCGNAAITYTNYNNHEVVISGAQSVGNWELDTGNIYKTSDVTWDLGDGANQVFVDGEMMIEARWPNSYDLDVMRPNMSDFDEGSETISSSNAYINITDSALPFTSSGEMDGMRVVTAYAKRYSTHSGVINASANGWFTFIQDDSIRDLVADDNGEYYVYGNYSLLDAPGEWYYNSSSGELFLWVVGGGSPENVTVKRRDVVFNLTNRSEIVLSGLKITAGRILTDRYSHDLTFDDLNITYPDHYQRMVGADVGRYGSGTSGNLLYGYNHVVNNVWARFAPGSMFSLMGHDINITNSTMFDSDYMATVTGVLATGNGDSGTITRNIRIENNTLYNSGRDVVRHDYSENFKLLGNIIFNTSVGWLTRDLGVVNSISTNHRGGEIAYNTIYDGGYTFTGIYFDGSYANNISIHDNLIYGIRWGILGFKDNMKIYQNTIDISNASELNAAGFFGTYQHSKFEGTVVKNNLVIGESNGLDVRYDDNNFGSDLTYSELISYYSDTEVVQENNTFTSSPDSYVGNASEFNYTLLSSSSLIDAGALISGFHCSESYDDNPLQYDCAYWIGSAPDLGAYEYPNTFLKNWIDTPTASSGDEDTGDDDTETTDTVTSGGGGSTGYQNKSEEENASEGDLDLDLGLNDSLPDSPLEIETENPLPSNLTPVERAVLLSFLIIVVLALVLTLWYVAYLLYSKRR